MDISLILSDLGFDWRVALANLANFLIIVWLLKKFAFKPIKETIERRQKLIMEGLDKTVEAEKRLKEVDRINKEKMKETDLVLINMVKETDKKLKTLEKDSQIKIEEKHLQLQKDLQENYKKQNEEMKNIVYKNALGLVKEVVVKAVNIDPKNIDENLIKKVVSFHKK